MCKHYIKHKLHYSIAFLKVKFKNCIQPKSIFYLNTSLKGKLERSRYKHIEQLDIWLTEINNQKSFQIPIIQTLDKQPYRYINRWVNRYMYPQHRLGSFTTYGRKGSNANSLNARLMQDIVSRLRGYKTFFVVNSTEHDISTAHKN